MSIDIKKCKKAFTHGGVFHGDDVFATALLQILNPTLEIQRGFVVPENFDGIVYDIGFGEFDHHQENRRVRDNGIPYAAFGLLWEAYGSLLMDEEDAKKFDENFIQPLDNSDNTGEKNELALIISDFNATWKNRQENSMEEFFQAVSFAKNILNNRFEQIKAIREAKVIVEEQMRQCSGKVLYLEQVVPWKSTVSGSEFCYVIYQSQRGGYNIQAVPDSEDKTKLVKPFPMQWCGKTDMELQQMTGIQGFRFCHISGFLCAADTLEDAQRVAELALKS